MAAFINLFFNIINFIFCFYYTYSKQLYLQRTTCTITICISRSVLNFPNIITCYNVITNFQKYRKHFPWHEPQYVCNDPTSATQKLRNRKIPQKRDNKKERKKNRNLIMLLERDTFQSHVSIIIHDIYMHRGNESFRRTLSDNWIFTRT